MTLYLTFPVAMFWIANQAEWFEDSVIQRKVGTGRVFKCSLQGVGEGMGYQPNGDQCLPSMCRPALGVGLWSLLAGLFVTLSPQRELWPPEKEDQVSNILLLRPEGWRGLGPCGHDEFQGECYPES